MADAVSIWVASFELICFGFYFLFFYFSIFLFSFLLFSYIDQNSDIMWAAICFFVLMRLVLAYERTSGWLSDFELFCVYYSIHVLTFLFVGFVSRDFLWLFDKVVLFVTLYTPLEKQSADSTMKLNFIECCGG